MSIIGEHIIVFVLMIEWMNKFYFANEGIDRDMSYKKIPISYIKIT